MDNFKIIAGKTVSEWKAEIPVISDIIDKNGFEKYLIANRKEVDDFFTSDISNQIDFHKIIVKDSNYEEVLSLAVKYIS